MKKTTFILFSILSLTTFAQEMVVDRIVSFGPATTSYRGDLNNNYSKLSGGLNIQIIPVKDKLIQTSLEVNIGNVVGQNSAFISEKEPSREPNTFFQTNFASFSLNVRAYLYRRNNFNFFIAQGIGGIRYVPKNELEEKLVTKSNTRSNSENSYGNLTIMLPRTAGISYLFKNDYGLSLDVSQLNPMTDYIDNISALGNSKKKDKILMYRLGIMIPLIYKEKEIIGKAKSNYN